MASRMIDPNAIRSLLSENVDEDAANFALCTSHGTLLSVDDRVHLPTQRSFAALVGLTWRRHAAEVEDRGSPSIDIQHVRTLRLMHRSGQSKHLEGMVVEWEGIVAVVEEVKQDVLLIAQRPLNQFRGEQDPLGKRLAALALDAEAVNDGYGEPGVDDTAMAATGWPKIRILELRAQGMAEAVAEHWPGPLPQGFY